MDKQATLEEVFSLDPVEALRLVEMLTPRQTQVVSMLVMGKTREAISTELGMSPRTFDVHMEKVKIKWKCVRYGIGRIYWCYKLWMES